MPVFQYRALSSQGRNVKGTIDADNLRAAKSRLKKDGLYVVEINDKARTQKNLNKNKITRARGVSTEDLAMMTRQLATLIKAGIPLVESLGAVSEQVENPQLAVVMAEIKNAVNEGNTLHRSLAKYPRIFDVIYISMCEAGEMSGTLDVILLRLAEFTESQNELQSRIRSAMLYPILMFVFTGLLLVLIFTYVIPKIRLIFDQNDQALPWYSQLVIDISDLLIDYWAPLTVVVTLVFVGFNYWKSTPVGSAQWDGVKLRLPLFGRLIRLVAVSRFSRTLATLLNGGVPMLNSMSIVRNVVSNAVLAKAIDEGRENISEGESIAGPLKRSGQFPPMVIHMISVGEKTGELENMLIQVSEAYDFQVRNQVEGLTALLGPLMIIIMGGVIGLIVFAIMVPIFEMSNSY